MSAEFYIPADLADAAYHVEIACGHGALAAVLGVGVFEAFSLLGDREGAVNMPQMEGALKQSGCVWRKLAAGQKVPAEGRGIVMVQWLGPWMRAPVFVQCQYRHWIAVRGGVVWDINWPGAWMTKKEWLRCVHSTPGLMPVRCTGWDVAGTWELLG